MLKHIWLCAACLLGGSLMAETIGNAEFQFPPSNCEWKVLLDNTFFENSPLFTSDEEEDLGSMPPADYTWGAPLDKKEEGDQFEMPKFKIFTHREGDALETFVAIQLHENGDDEDNEMGSLEQRQKELDETINKYLPNHRFILHAFSENDDEIFGEWEMNDGKQDVMHGFTRLLKINGTNDDHQLFLLGYLTTAVRNENNRALWTNVLNQVHISN